MSDQIHKVVIIGPAYPLRGGGMATFNERLALEFTSLGYDSEIYTFSYQYPGFLFPGTSQYSTEEPPEGISIKVKINSVNPLNWWKVGNELRKMRPDLIVVRFWLPFMGPCFGTILRRVKKNGHTRIVCIADNLIPHEKRPGDRLFTRYFIKPVDAFIAMSELVEGQIRSMAPQKKVKFIPHPLYDHFGDKLPAEVARKHLKIETNVRLLLFFGFIRKYKGLDILLKAIGILAQQPGNEDLKLLVAGEFYEDEKHYADLLNDPSIQPHLILRTQFIPNSEVKYYLSAADCVVQPYRSATQSGVTPLAYHFEVPMIVTDVGGLPAMVPDGKVGLVAHPEAADLAQKIAQFFTLGKAYFVPRLQEEKQKYSWSNMVQALVKSATV
ncbi:MAG: glycosyltransferase family 4 protein [Chitinophagaceae bacterium]|nr:glycosyltransferase family 4 protein [Chitinophagaceae bacterium]MCW5913896.1 glycosyltransferase family 4 protein [Chitinophagaceae bacterium]MCZ2397993.1 glycosyltransferase family 4 protein [Chitinophagales bacterium]